MKNYRRTIGRNAAREREYSNKSTSGQETHVNGLKPLLILPSNPNVGLAGFVVSLGISKWSSNGRNPNIAEYVNRIGQNLVRYSDAKVPFTIKVLDSEEVNAFALPGGFFFVNSGLILKANNEGS